MSLPLRSFKEEFCYAYINAVGAYIQVITSTVPIKPPMFATVKSVNYLPNILAQMEAEEKGAFTAVWLDQEGLIAEGPNMNLAFLRKDGLLLVPPCEKVLAGCNAQRMLHLISQLVPEKAIPGLNGVKIQNLTVAEAKDAVEMMLIGSGVLVKPIVEWDGEPVGDGKFLPPSTLSAPIYVLFFWSMSCL